MSLPFALRLARPYLRWRLGRDLDGLWVGGLEHARSALAAGPVIFAANHVSWWDGLVLLALDEVLGIQGRFVMDAANLRRVPYARHVGAIGLDLGSALGARHGLREATEALAGPLDAVWLFPQGRQRPSHVRPLGLSRGVRWLQRSSGATVVPVAFAPGFRDDPRPAFAVSFGPPLATDAALVPALEASLTTQLDALHGWFDGEALPVLTAVVRPRCGRPEAGWLARALAWFTRRPTANGRVQWPMSS